MNLKGLSTPQAILGVGFLMVFAVAAVVFGSSFMSVQTQQDSNEDLTAALTVKTFSGYDVEVEVHDLASEQDAADDIDIDFFEWDPDANDDLKGDYIVDCSGATPVEFDGTHTQTDVPQTAFCEINVYKFLSDTNYNAGNSETKIADHLKVAKADLNDISGTTAYYHVNNEKVYLATICEKEAADNYDLIPMAFLFTSATETTLDPSELENGNINVRFSVDGYADAGGLSRLTVSGEYEDSEDNDGNLDATLAGIVDASLTTATQVDIDGTIELEVNKDGYALILKNPLAQSNSEKAYLVVTPYGLGHNGSAYDCGTTENSEAWEEYGSGDLTGDVGYGATDCATTSEIIWQDMSVCGATISDSSTSDAVKMGDEKLYEPSCWNVEKRNGAWGIWGDDDSVVMDFHISTVTVDYNSAVNATNGVLDYASGSSPEVFADIDLVGLQDSSQDLLSQTLG